MKKQLIVSSLLLVVFATQCSYYDKMKASAARVKASAQQKYEQAKAAVQSKLPALQQKYEQAKVAIQSQLPAVKQMVMENLPAVQEYAITRVLPTAQRIIEEKTLFDRNLQSEVSRTPAGKAAFDKVQEVYMQNNYPDWEKRADGEWVNATQATTGGAAGAMPMSEEDRLYMEELERENRARFGN